MGRRGKERDQIPGGTAQVEKFMKTPQGHKCVQRTAYLFWQHRGGTSTPDQMDQDIQDATIVVEIGLLRQLARKFGINL